MFISIHYRIVFLIFLLGITFGCDSSCNGESDSQKTTEEVVDTGPDDENDFSGTDAGNEAPSIGQADSQAFGCGDFVFDPPPIDIGGNLASGYEPSGADWHETLNKILLVSDEGVVSMMSADGSGLANWNVGGDLEGITVADETSDFIYLGVENPDGIKEFNFVTGQVTRSFNLTPWMQGASNAGLEALIFVPDDFDPEGGLFYAGHQGEGSIYVFKLPIKTSSSSTVVEFVKKWVPVPGRTDLAGLDYEESTGLLYAIYDSANKLSAFKLDGTLVQEWALPHNDQEGFVRSKSCDFIVAQDTGKKVWFYERNDNRITASLDQLTRLSNRLSQIQNDDGSFDWQQDINLPLTPQITGFQNVTGITALGFFDADLWIDAPLLQGTLDATASYLDGLITAFLVNPADVSKNLSCPNWTFLAWYLEINPTPALQDKVINAFGQLLDVRDPVFGNDPGMRVDGIINRIIQARVALPGIIPWDLSLCVEAVGAMANLSENFSSDYGNALSLLSTYTQNTFLPQYDADPTLESGDISLAMPLFVMATSPQAPSFEALIEDLLAHLKELVAPSGQVTNSSANDNAYQATAYALLAFKGTRDESAQNVQTYLESLIGEFGVVDPATNLETYEVDGEILRALSYGDLK